MQGILAHLRSKAMLYGAAVLLGAFIFFFSGRGNGNEQLLTIARGPFVQEVSVSGKVVAAQDVELGFSQSGRVAGVYAKAGDRVRAGASLAELENDDARAGVLQKEAALERERASLALLEEGTRPEEIAVARSEVERDEVALAQARGALVEAVQDGFTTSDDAVRNTLDQFIDTPRTAPQLDFIVNDSQLENKVENARLAMEGTLAAWQGSVATLDVSGLPAALPEAQGNLSGVSSLLTDASAALNKAVLTGSVTQAVVDGYKTDVASARSSINAAISSLSAAITAEKNAVSALETSRRSLALKEAGARGSDVAAQEANVKAAEAELANARAPLAKTLVRAPFTGIVTRMDFKTGAIASANVPGAGMVSDGVFQIESFVPEVNIALIEVGDGASVTLDAYGSDAAFSASVISIDPAETVRDGVSTYRSLLLFSGADPRIKPGMTANVRITTDMRDGVIGIPQGIVTEREGKKYVRVKAGDAIAEREVSTGAVSSLGNIEILSGLSEGETVVLSPGS